MTRAFSLATALALLLAVPVVAQNVTNAQLEKGLADPEGWLNYSGDYAGQRHSPLTQITPANVGQLSAQWAFQTAQLGKFEATPIVLNGVIYITGPNNAAWAIDARTGRQLWSYRRDLPEGLNVCCGRVNRGFAVLGDKLYMNTLDAHLLAFDMKTGSIVWDVVIDDYKLGYTATSAPLVVKDKIVVGIAGAEYGIRGFIDAFDATTGKRAWRFWTVPGPGEKGHETWEGDSWKRGGGSTWVTGTYDTALDLIYWGTGNPGPDLYGNDRDGDNLYTDSVVALDADTGVLKWHYQFTPHDTHDWDSTQPMVLVDEPWQGRPRKLLVHGDRNGVFYVLDRTNGEVLLTSNLSTKVTWHLGFEKDGRPIVDPRSISTRDGVAVCPGSNGGANWPAASYSPATRLFYIRVLDSCGVFSSHHDPLGVRGDRWFGRGTAADESRAALKVLQGDMPTQSYIRGMDPFTGKKVWDYATPATRAGVMSTAGGLVFLGAEGGLVALDAKTGQPVWNLNLGQNTSASPMSYMVGGKQYIVQPGTGIIVSYALR
jgi:alcohol dehydrogenase (cytochrome c)